MDKVMGCAVSKSLDNYKTSDKNHSKKRTKDSLEQDFIHCLDGNARKAKNTFL